jgi:hypothetical protein
LTPLLLGHGKAENICGKNVRGKAYLMATRKQRKREREREREREQRRLKTA